MREKDQGSGDSVEGPEVRSKSCLSTDLKDINWKNRRCGKISECLEWRLVKGVYFCSLIACHYFQDSIQVSLIFPLEYYINANKCGSETLVSSFL